MIRKVGGEWLWRCGGGLVLLSGLIGCRSMTGSVAVDVGSNCAGLSVTIDGKSFRPQAGKNLGETFSDGRKSHTLTFTHAGKTIERKVEGDLESYVTVECEPLRARVSN